MKAKQYEELLSILKSRLQNFAPLNPDRVV
ncbi:hypothetical protein FHS09_003747 [Microbulbifer rhizosphaerae]|uniref:Uncharacterized protein n=1 Tax=Microbulbifer rhizosphaerae TaxID=1562603 RepID=A0A7W4WER1_9GAMM|nr:hypothetical protein [Microbulbifer rhizosphaerae]